MHGKDFVGLEILLFPDFQRKGVEVIRLFLLHGFCAKVRVEPLVKGWPLFRVVDMFNVQCTSLLLVRAPNFFASQFKPC